MRLPVAYRLIPCLLLAACQGEYSGGLPGTGEGSGTPGSRADDKSFFIERIQPRLGFCRTCHIPEGVADTPEGERFLLATDATQDYALFRSAWDRMAGGVDSSPLLIEASVASEPHSGGKPWPVGSDAHADLRTLLSCWNAPGRCSLRSSGDAIAELPLLGSKRGGHYWFDYCEGRPDSAVVPEDPRALVVPGTNAGKAVYFNAHWQVCQDDDHPGTCGELRARSERGRILVAADGEVGAGHFFGGNAPDAGYAFPAGDYAEMWSSVWGLSERPDNYDELVAQRWGMPLSNTHNPYPLAGEDPNASDGGSGQLPIGLTQLRNTDGSWTGNLNVTCSICHGGKVGDVDDGPGLGTTYATNSISDITVMFTDLSQLAPQQGALAMVSQNKVRGTGNITNFQLFGTLTLNDQSTFPYSQVDYLTLQGEPSTGTEDPPVWWNVGHRVAKFFDAGQVMGSKRIELSFHFPNTPFHQDIEADKQWILDHQQDSDAWLMSLRSPPWPENRLGAIDTALAEQGAILFHSKDLWAADMNNPSPAPAGGNGSCASCHGAYSPRFVNDPAYLDDPVLEGIAAHVVPIEVINTDDKRLIGNSQTVADASTSNWFAYSDADDSQRNENGIPLCGNWNDENLRQRPLGYLAPPLYGVWATAPYFHNGSVPNIRQVLLPRERPRIWRRLSQEPRADQAGQFVMGFDTSLGTGYDPEQMGWRYESLPCGSGSSPVYDCNPAADDGATVQDGLNLLWENGGLAWNLLNPPIMSDQQIEERKVYNTNYYSQYNTGHEFTEVLSERELAAIMEYLKTL